MVSCISGRPSRTRRSTCSARAFEALVAENDRLALSRFGNRRHDGQMISGVQRDRLGDRRFSAVRRGRLSNLACISSRRSRIRASTDGAGFRKSSRAASTSMLLPTPGRSVATSSRPQTPSLSRTVTLRRAEALRLREGRRVNALGIAHPDRPAVAFSDNPQKPHDRDRGVAIKW